MNQEPHLNAYGTSIFPIIVAAAKAGRMTCTSLRQFIETSTQCVEDRIKRTAAERTAVNSAGISRSERLSAGRYFDLDLRVRRAQLLALAELTKYLHDGHKHWLDQALLQYETGERYRQKKIRYRLDLPAFLCERFTNVRSQSAKVA